MAFKTYTACRYALPLREGGSLPAVIETEDGSLFAVKFRGAGQGARALIAELIVGEMARRVGLPVPELALIQLNEGFGRTEPDPEIQDILRASHGTNVGLRFLEGAFTYDPVAVADQLDPEQAADIVWLDALTTNIDRSPRNPNLLFKDQLWLIDHGAALYFHHNWDSVDDAKVRTPFTQIAQHVLLPHAGDLRKADQRMISRLNENTIREILAAVPDELLMDAPSGTTPSFASPQENRDAYLRYFSTRLEASRAFAEEATRAQEQLHTQQARPLSYRR